MSLPIKGFNVSLPLDWIGQAFAKVRFGDRPIQFTKGARYQINGEWFQIESVLQTGLVMRLVNTNARIEDADHH